MPLTALHHVEMCVANGQKYVSYFTNKLGFSLRAWRQTSFSQQWVVGSQKSAFLITQRKSIAHDEIQKDPFHVTCCQNESQHQVDSVFNVALEVKNVDRTTENVTKNGGKLLREPCDVSDSSGTVRYSIVGSCCGNIVHTLLDKTKYKGPFLPTFNATNTQEEKNSLTSHVDHVTYICHPGESASIIQWYEKCFGMKKFLTNRSEDPVEGLVLRDRVNMRMRVMDYWRCAETGICAPENDKNDGSTLKIVLAESLPDQKNSHITTFLEQHRGPGLQHIGLHSSSIMDTVQCMMDKGIEFRRPPPAYYRQPGKLDEIAKAGMDVKKFCNLGILVDPEADSFDNTLDQNKNRFLLQLFTLPLFETDTFFLEILQRQGTRGFGAGNVTALVRSIEEQEKEEKNQQN